MMSAGPDAWTVGVLAAYMVLAVAVVALAVAVRGLSRRGAAPGGDQRALDRLAAVERDLGAALRRIEHLAAKVDRLADDAQGSLQHVNLVRYDAFKELGGHLSFSLALLDARRDGVVLSALNGRDGARVYAKPIAGGRSTFTLSEEEQRALTQD
jgi:hypothetical protein